VSLNARELRRLHEAATPAPWDLDLDDSNLDADRNLAIYLRNHVEDFLEDRERLDWLETQADTDRGVYLCTDRNIDDQELVVLSTDGIEYNHTSIRAAIDMARNTE
jgi:hypothetical protein